MDEKEKTVRLANVGELENSLKKDLAEEEAKGKSADILFCESIEDELSDLGNLPTIDPETLRPVSEWELNPYKWTRANISAARSVTTLPAARMPTVAGAVPR